MKDRIAHIIRAKNLTAAEFAVRLGIQPSNVSHILAGRNNPSLDFVKKLKETFPEYNLDWIVFGIGPMTLSEPFMAAPQPVETAPKAIQNDDNQINDFQPTLFPIEKEPLEGIQERPAVATDRLKRLIMVYDDGTFEILSPR